MTIKPLDPMLARDDGPNGREPMLPKRMELGMMILGQWEPPKPDPECRLCGGTGTRWVFSPIWCEGRLGRLGWHPMHVSEACHCWR